MLISAPLPPEVSAPLGDGGGRRMDMRSEDPDSQATGAGPGSHCLGRGVAKARDVKPVLRQACGPGLRRNGGVASLQGQGLQEEGVAGAEEELEGGSSRHGLRRGAGP